MQIQVNTGNHVEGDAGLTNQVEAVVEAALRRFGDRITRVEVHLSDEGGAAKSGSSTVRCLMEARLANRQPVSVSHQATSLGKSLGGAAGKLGRVLDSTLGRLNDPKGGPSLGRLPQP